ncbi:MAG: hypothetical protein KGM91_26770, partial [Burkholderiales bacterium]|nr:hypothetical protein [Burkholderiales bacterium]
MTGSPAEPDHRTASGRSGHHSHSGHRGHFSAGYALLALVSAGAALFLAVHHPLSPALASAFALALAGVTAWRPLLGLALLPALLPAIDLMPWTGWLTFEEFDIAVLAVAAGGYARLCVHRPQASAASGTRAAKGLLLLLYGAAVGLAMLRGFADAGGFAWGWWQGYQEPMNSLRVAKPFYLALLLLPLWRARFRANPGRAARWFSGSLAAGFGVVSLLALWERWANTGLANFSSDYRTTALFWEMHVGGAALDAFLALTAPFAVRELGRANSPRRWALAAGVVVIGAYACVTTFSRDVYLAVPAGLALMALLAARQGGRPDAPAPGRPGRWPGAVAAAGCLAFALAAAAVFPGSGYR